MENKNILVTGGAGAVGTNLIEALLAKGNKVTSWDNYSAGKVDNHIAGANYHPISTIQSVEALQDDFDLIYHLGEYSKVVPSFDEITNAFTYNILGSFKLLEAIRKNNIPVVYAGSSTKLSYPGELHSPYAFFKSTIAKLVQGYGDWYDIKYNICYFYNVYGPRTDTWGNEWQSVINIFKKQKEEGLPLTITGDGTQRRDFTHVNDIVNGLILAGSNIRNQEFQLGTGVDYSILEIANAFDHHFEFIDARRGDRPKGLADISTTKDVLGYEPTYNIIDYIKSL
jgi:UDP-glucose 4-epimerase|tara:strand:- start:2165 stop:3013 length:849 start_codon:yes stop_codon:yes gene_type:complete